MGKRVVTPDMEDEMFELQEKGWSTYEIADKLGVGHVTVWRHLDPDATERNTEANYRLQKKVRLAIQVLLGSKCSGCGEVDWRVLEINHLSGGGRKDYEKYGGARGLYYAILRGERPTNDLSLLCANCQTLAEYERGSYKIENLEQNPRARAVKMLGAVCVKCGNNDLRVLQVNHISGGGCKDYRKYGRGYGLYHAILDGRRPTDDLDVRCANCNIFYEYEVGKRKDPGLGTPTATTIARVGGGGWVG